jgi:predicted outer membrane repeat protein
VSVFDSKLADNQAGSGGAVYTSGGCNLAVHNSSFARNNASYGGALTATELSNVTLRTSSLELNTAVDGGGALQVLAQSKVRSTVANVASAQFKHM